VQALTAVEARRIALAAQGFGARRPAKPGVSHLRAVANRLHALQIDTVNALVRAHYLPHYSRLGAYPIAALDRLTNDRHELVETRVGHQASYVPVELTPLLRWRLEDPRQSWRKTWRAGIDPGYVAAVEQEVVERGPLALSDLDDPRRREKRPPHELSIRRRDGQPYAASSLAWGRPSDGKTVLDGLLAEGRLALAGRRGSERLYDVVDRVIPASVRDAPTPTAVDAQRELVRLSASALGVATIADLADYFGLRLTPVRRAVRDLVDAGVAEEVRVDGWTGPAFIIAGTRPPRRPIDARALLGPFDSLTWSRDRVLRLFDFAFSFEIYVPEPKRRYGYYVLPFLLGEALVARVDLKADRAGDALLVQGAFGEGGVDRAAVVRALAAELHDLAGWLGLSRVEVKDRGDLARSLRRVA
jgi:uncharacterized protein YcaQ